MTPQDLQGPLLMGMTWMGAGVLGGEDEREMETSVGRGPVLPVLVLEGDGSPPRPKLEPRLPGQEC